ncbi:hypothetical protein L7F22_060688 [Adiantum nelumboides]|nr:hypothetical protein [Adiantum nelumboides]
MYVVKRDGQREGVQFDKITARLTKLSYGLNAEHCDPVLVAQKVCGDIFSGIPTREVDTLAAQTAAARTANHPDYSLLAARIAVSTLHKLTNESFSQTVTLMYNHVDEHSKLPEPLIAEDVYGINADRLNSEIVYNRDFDYDYFGFKTLEQSYLLKVNGVVAERPQQMLMRVAIGIHKHDIDAATRTYHLMSQHWFIHASPTLFNAGTPRPQACSPICHLSSCFLVCMKEDSIEGIYDTLKDCAIVSKLAGGIGLSIHNIRATGSYIRGTNGTPNGVVPMLHVFNNTARYVDQGGGKRRGAFAIYLEPWHADIFDWLDLRKNYGKVKVLKAGRDLFYGLWIPDLFMRRVSEHASWSLFCPKEVPGLADCWGDEFENLYLRYVREGRARRVIEAQVLWCAICQTQVETGNPYMVYKDSCNRKSNQQNLGTIKSSNLCTEIVEFTSKDETAVCNLASIALPRFVREKGVPIDSHPSRLLGSRGHKNCYFDFEKLGEVTSIVTCNLNRTIDVNYYPVESAKRSNLRHRPIGIGVQGLADTFILLGLPFDSEEAQHLNKEIFEAIFYHALKQSMELAKKKGPYETYFGSPISKAMLQPDMWQVEPSNRWDWMSLRKMILQHGVRNSLLVAPASYLISDLTDIGLWNLELKNEMIKHDGSIQKIQTA